MNIVIDNFKADLDRLIDNAVTINSNERKDLVNRITEMVFEYDARYVVLNEMEEYLKGGKENVIRNGSGLLHRNKSRRRQASQVGRRNR